MSLQEDIQSVIAESRTEIGIAIWHIESGEALEINGDHFYPMASVFKIPILATAFHQVRQGRISLDDRRTLHNGKKSAGSGILPFFQDGLAPTFQDLFMLMIIISDNTATDMVIERVGGPAAVENYMHEIGLTDIYFKMNCKDLLRTALPEGADEVPLEQVEALIIQKGMRRDSVAFSTGSDNNVSTPRAMTRLLRMIFNAEIVERQASDQMLQILLKQQLKDRLPRFLPPGTRCAHKTGTIGGFRNDSGIIYIGDDNHVAVTIYVRWDDEAVWLQPVAERQRIFEIETAMGQIGRLVYDHYCAG